MNLPKILAPAGDKNSFLAAIAAGADAIYCGLKIFSARMEAGNFGIEELAGLSKLADSKNIEVYIAFNSIIKESELPKAWNLIKKLVHHVTFKALIIQDIGLIPLARTAGFEGEFHLSTLGNLTFPKGLETAAKLGLKKIVLPREFTIDEIKKMANHLPSGLEIETFVHGALCYSVSGRCYWSSWFGGKSSLRGRCVQPCRRIYDQKGTRKRYFSCMDFSTDVLSKVLKSIPEVTTWKIEGRKKSPHYVFYTVKAYRLFRDDPKRKKEALSFLEYAMGREFTHYNLLTQRRMNPLDHASETGSGLFAGRVMNPPSPYFLTREALFPGDLIRIGFEDDSYHDIQKVTRAIPKKGKFFLAKSGKTRIKKGTPVFIIDRRGPELEPLIKALNDELGSIEKTRVHPVEEKLKPLLKTGKGKTRFKPIEMVVSRKQTPSPGKRIERGVWASFRKYKPAYSSRDWIWTDPVFFPDEEKLCKSFLYQAVKKGVKNYIVNAVWQISLFDHPENLNIWAGPFCNISNSSVLNQLELLGFKGAVVSPELEKDTFTSLPNSSPIPLGVVIAGNWPLGISRIISPDLNLSAPFVSPKGETAWVSRSNNNFFIFPNWKLDLSSKKEFLKKSGYSMFIRMDEFIPASVKMKKRPGLWNWDLKLL